MNSRSSYLVGIDIGGTFTDCAIVDRAGKLLTTKVPSTPADFSRGMMDALDAGAQALGIGLDRFCRDIDAGKETFLDPYAAEHEAEFFAVASEAFFESPNALTRDFAPLYELFKGFYKQDPARRLGA